MLDGQQRLTTFFILMAVIRDIAKNEDLNRHVMREYIRKKIIQKIPERTRLELMTI